MKTFSAAEMRKLDDAAAKRFGIPTLLLMENAGRGISDLAELCVKRSGNILIVCGSGNNGGDGFVAARHLSNRDYPVRVILLGNPKNLKADSKINFDILKKMKITVLSSPKVLIGDLKLDSRLKCTGMTNKQLIRWIENSDLIIDAIFGTGLSRPVTGIAETVIKQMNESRKKILAIDIPSGIHSDSGKVLGAAVKASITGTLGALKRGLVRKPGSAYAGKIKILDISIPRQLMR